MVHRVAFWLEHGREPGQVVKQTCGNRRCCNPRHLEETTLVEVARHVVRRPDWRPSGGRPPNLKLMAKARDLRVKGEAARKIAEKLGVSRSTVHRWVA
jgi:hypothetical protein